MSGTMDMVIVGGSESMSAVPIGSSVMDGVAAGHGQPWGGEGMQARYGEGVQFSQFEGAELTAEKYGITREEMDSFAELSHKRAAQATAEGRFRNEIIPLTANINLKEGAPPVFQADE